MEHQNTDVVHQKEQEWCMGRTNIHIDDSLVDEAMRLTGARSKREVVDIALRRLVEKGTLYKAARQLRGKLKWDGAVGDWRSNRLPEAR